MGTSLPARRGLFYGEDWHEPVAGAYAPTFDPGRGSILCGVAESTAEDADKVVESAQTDFFAGLVTEMKGATIPMGPNALNYSIR